MKAESFAELFDEAERHEDYHVAGAILAFNEEIVREMERKGLTRTELAHRLGATPAYVTKILRGRVNFTLATMVRLARALDTELVVQLNASGGRLVVPITEPSEAVKPASNSGAARAQAR
jgi:transcriptional regulator with XRE-family HTH domain